MATSMEMAVFWDVAPFSLLDPDRRFRGTYSNNDAGGKLLWNVDQYLPEYMMHHPRRHQSLFEASYKIFYHKTIDVLITYQ
jgi:hypothetical protein